MKRLNMRRSLVALAALLLVGGLAALDLSNQGALWRGLYGLTGEEAPLAQLTGFVEYLGNFTRPQPNTAPLTPIQHTETPPYGVNTFLQNEVEIAKRERQLQMIAAAGFAWIRQQFPWEDIEIHARGDFEDRRNVEAVGVISAWDKYDNIVALAEKYGLRIMARLDNPPAWTHVRNPDIGSSAPPDEVQDFVNYAVTVAERYKGRLRYYQIWNEPNIYPEWGNQPVDPEAYTDLLCRTYRALKAVDPDIVVISGPLSPTVSLTPENLNDFIFLQRMYDAGAGACFDVMSAQGYGFYSGPTDRRMRPTTLTYARHIYIRDLMVANGDAHKPIWLSEAAWNAQPEDPAIVQIQYGVFGIATPEQAARYMPLAYQRAQEEWPWLGVIFYWFFKHENDSRANQAFYYFRMVEPDFRPLPVYESMKQHITAQTPALHPGVYQAEHWAVTASANAAVVAAEGALFGRALRADTLRFSAAGTDILLRFKAPQESAWRETLYRRSALPMTLETVIGEPGQTLLFDCITVLDRSLIYMTPYALAALIPVGLLLGVIIRALRERRR